MKYAEKLFKEMCKTGADSVTFEDAKTNTTFRLTLEQLKFVKKDPYAHLKEAQARGEIIQENLDYYCLGEKTFWIDKAKNVNFIGEPDRYRIKPKGVYCHCDHCGYEYSAHEPKLGCQIQGCTVCPMCYRPENKPKTKTLYKWAYRHKTTKSWKETDRWMESEEDFRKDYLWVKDWHYQRLDYTAIEVEA